ncbi:MAG TPA: hypothetical protein VH763_01055 [Gemmatimonadales bacterium]|jgi:hypothetical protein
MDSRWRSLLAAMGVVLTAPPLAAQQGKELGLQAIGTASDPALAVVGVYGAIRTASRIRLSAAAGAGISRSEAAWRGELLVHFLLSPTARRGPGVYAAGGVAAAGGPVERGYIVLTLGVEDSPGQRGGWFAEAGVGGGARLALGYRWRWSSKLGRL